ncbi:hypothetical protein [Flavobacterium terrae]|uniref:Uncharacterized protein n=1 Tax=Flavobacterium terrae TaxID=415425 RepID=A0A1M6AI06_9FLAO|nr:hypothetical protein [Flavobacterium terrae]SHI36067.1 hypothetical protein SAMN05444363_0224 [Flavobacterium terrae]
MDFDDIQKAWNNDHNNEIKLPNNLEKLQSANMPLDKIRKNLKNEFIYQVLAIVFIGCIPFLYNFTDLLATAFYGLFALFLVICAYFLVKLFWFYKRLNTPNTSTKDNLYDTYFDIRLNMELYKSFTYSIVPFALAFAAMIILKDHSQEIVDVILNKKSGDFILGGLFGMFVGVMISVGFMTEWWVNYFYGKYAKEIRKIIDKLKE